MLTEELKARFDQYTQNNDVVVFMKGTPTMPSCGFSARAIACFNQVGYTPEQICGVNVLEMWEDVLALCEYSDWPTFPQIYIKGEFIGGGDILLEMLQAGELKEMLIEKQILAA